jgi:uncharacterized protein YukE
VTDLKARTAQILAADPSAVRAAAAKIRDTAAEVRGLCSGLGEVVSGNVWEGASKDAYVQAADAKVALAAEMVAGMGGIAGAVDSYAVALAAAQAQGRQAERLWAQANRARLIAAGAVPPAAGTAALRQAEALNRAAEQVAAAAATGLDQAAEALAGALGRYGSALQDASGAINWGETMASPLYFPGSAGPRRGSRTARRRRPVGRGSGACCTSGPTTGRPARPGATCCPGSRVGTICRRGSRRGACRSSSSAAAGVPRAWFRCPRSPRSGAAR